MKKNPAAVSLGSQGGKSNFKKIGTEGMKKLSQLALAARRSKKLPIDQALGK